VRKASSSARPQPARIHGTPALTSSVQRSQSGWAGDGDRVGVAMCGLACVMRWDGRLEAEAVRQMTDVLVHRGPDDSGLFLSGPVGFGFRRLAILDLSPAAHQPMTTPDGRFTIVFNGEIYNYVELRKELMSHGHSFRSTGDSEVLLRAWAEWG